MLMNLIRGVETEPYSTFDSGAAEIRRNGID
jgi:hypothetical protein